MKMHLLSGGRLRMRRSVYYPGAPREETFELPVICALLQHIQGNVLFDTGCHPAVADDPEGRWGSLTRVMTPIFQAQDAVVNQLPLAGLEANDIDVVVCSHLHADHCGCNGFFKRATMICHARELEVARSPDALAMGYFRADWDQGAPIQTIEAQHDLFGDGRLTLLPVPGHTPGMTVAHAVLDRDGAFVLASDAVPVSACLEQRYAPRNSWDIERAVSAIDEIARLGDDGATVVFGHDDAQWRDLRKGAEFYE
jgi:N-acyl homoserine lactone hydrolase